jgi:sugar/nucleoside kinase (ribokinase family)
MDDSFDLFLQGTVFLDVVLTGLDAMPARGTEVLADGMGSCPGGIANLAIAASRLGVHTSLAAAFGDDAYADFCWSTLQEQEGVDLTHSRRFPGWHSPVTVSMVVDRDRAMVTHAHPMPLRATEMIGTLP